jgi:hypothetical protein
LFKLRERQNSVIENVLIKFFIGDCKMKKVVITIIVVLIVIGLRASNKMNILPNDSNIF